MTGVNWPAVRAAAGVMKKLADGTQHSEGNFHFAALASVPACSRHFFRPRISRAWGMQFAVGSGIRRGSFVSREGCSRFADGKTTTGSIFSSNMASSVENRGAAYR